MLNPSEVERRKAVLSSWDTLYASGVIPVHVWEYPRDSSDLGDTRHLPFLKDVLAAGMEKAKPDDVVVWTNDDIVLHPELLNALDRQIACFQTTSAHRCELSRQLNLDLQWFPCEFEARKIYHGGRDLFAFTKRWLQAHFDMIPDFLLGSSEFDYCLAAMIRHEKGFPVNWRTMHRRYDCCELPFGYVLHQMHQPVWATLGNDTAQKHNRRLFFNWATSNHIPIHFGGELQVIDE